MWDFDRPVFLVLFPVALAIILLARRRSLTHWTARQAALCLGLRALIAALLCLALAGPRRVTETTEPAVVFLRDVSASLSPEAMSAGESFTARAMPKEDKRAAEVLFAREPVISKPFGAKRSGTVSPPDAKDATDLASALEFAAAILPADRAGRIVLLCDGLNTSGHDPIETAAALAERNIEVDTVPLSSPAGQETAVTALKTPSLVREGEVFDLTAVIQAGSAVESATVRLYQNNLLVAERQTSLSEGSSEIVFPKVKAEGRTALYEVEVVSSADTHAENNRRKMVLMHGGPARVLVIDKNPEQSESLAAALRATDFQVDLRPPAGFPREMEGLEAFDLVVFADAPAADFAEGQFTLLQDWVRNFGGGFLMIGGEDSFGAGGYFRTAVATMLPVQIERQEREETPVVALLVILDRSGSMTAMAGGQQKIALANEGAVLALDVLQGKDLFGVFAVDTRVQDVVPLGKIGDRQAAARRIAGITAGGGGIYIYTSLAEAFPRLRDAQAKIKHIILFSDAADAEEKKAGEGGGSPGGGSALDLAAAMLASRITLSIVALGTEQDRDTAFLRQLAAAGGGRFYLTADATSLPRLFTLETMRAAESSLREDAFLASAAGKQPVLQGIPWSEAPLLLGLNISKLKPGAELLLTSEGGDPLFATWRYGLGQVAAFTSDAKARWASEWLGWPGYGKFWAQAARALVRDGSRKDFSVSVREEDDELVIEAEAVTPEGKFRDGLDVTVSIAAQGAVPVSLPAPQVAPGLYRAKIKTPDSESAMIAVSDGSTRPVAAAWTRDYPAEFRITGDGNPLLGKISALTSGKFPAQPEIVFRPAIHGVKTRQDLAPYFLMLALLLWPVDIWLRRRQFNE
ncbi:MAG: glutamine amidotransferase [Terrimicrobiaceae bacterium]